MKLDMAISTAQAKISAAELKEQEISKKKREEALKIEQKQLEKDLKKQREAKTKGLTRYEIQAIEFDWLFDDDNGKKFLIALAHTDDIEVFSVKIIQHIIFFLWSYYKMAIALWIMFPFILYFIMFIIYATFINNRKAVESDSNGNYHRTDLAFVIILLVLVAYNIYIEVRQMIYYKVKYFTTFWNLIDLTSLIMNAFVLIADLSKLNLTKFVPVLACAVLLMWLKLVYFGRMFLSTAWMVRMIFAVIYDLGYFLFVFGLMVLAFSNSFFVISRNNSPQFTGGDMGEAFKYTYRTAIGDFNTDVIPTNGYNVLIYIIWLLATFMLLIVLLNMLIALISDIFDKVHENISNNLLKELVVLMVESELLISRTKLFKRKKYIILISKETADSTTSDSDSKLGILKASMDVRINEQNETLQQITTNLEKCMDDSLDRFTKDMLQSTSKTIAVLHEKFDEHEALLNQYRLLYEKSVGKVNPLF